MERVGTNHSSSSSSSAQLVSGCSGRCCRGDRWKRSGSLRRASVHQDETKRSDSLHDLQQASTLGSHGAHEASETNVEEPTDDALRGPTHTHTHSFRLQNFIRLSTGWVLPEAQKNQQQSGQTRFKRVELQQGGAPGAPAGGSRGVEPAESTTIRTRPKRRNVDVIFCLTGGQGSRLVWAGPGPGPGSRSGSPWTGGVLLIPEN